MMKPIQMKRVYETPSPSDGKRILVDRLWPRGLTKEAAKVDLWLKEVAPSHELRRWFHSDPTQWAVFKQRYLSELRDREDQLERLVAEVEEAPVTFVYSSRDTLHNHAIILKEYLELHGRSLRSEGTEKCAGSCGAARQGE